MTAAAKNKKNKLSGKKIKLFYIYINKYKNKNKKRCLYF